MSLFHGVPSDRHRVHHGFLDRAAAAATSLETEQTPPTTLDEHVTVGGKFFDVLYGEYTLEALHNGSTRLHLVSRHRMSTDFNWHAHLWTDAVMNDLQHRILLVVKNRAEATQGPGRGEGTTEALRRCDLGKTAL
jgi:hypothetical protein